MKRRFNSILIIILIIFSGTMLINAEGVGKSNRRGLLKTSGEPQVVKFNINRISTYFYLDGATDIAGGNSGFEYPKGSGKFAFYESGFVWGAKIDGEKRVGGSTFFRGQDGGWIEPDGNPLPLSDPRNRMYRVRPDVKPTTVIGDVNLQSEVVDEGLSEAEVLSQYQKDWNEWPADKGAPYEDVDGNGSYNPAVDIPGVPGADQTIWYVNNDFNPQTTTGFYGSLPLQVEIQNTVWGYNTSGALGNTLFRKYVFINKNQQGKTFDDMYLSVWTDPDLGEAGNDFVGCDTTLSLGFVYNAGPNDNQYGGQHAAGGFDFFQGPLLDGIAGEDRNKNGIDDAEDYGIFKGQRVGPGKINLPMTAFYFFINPDPTYRDPTEGDYENGTLNFFNLFEGKVPTTGIPFQDPTNNDEPTSYALNGDPITKTGWVDGLLHSPGDRRFGQVSGPFTMAPGDTQEVVVAQIAAGAQAGMDRITALKLLKFYDKEAQLAYDNFFQIPSAPSKPLVQAGELDGEIVLEWGSDAGRVNLTETDEKGGFLFEGYNVYQLPSASASKDDAVLIASFDLNNDVTVIEGQQFNVTKGVIETQVLQVGTNSGIKRYLKIDTDQIKGGIPLNNGSPYYFIVTSYSFNPDPNAVPNYLENPINSGDVLTVVPQSTKPGERNTSEYGEVLTADHSSGSSDGFVELVVVNPNLTTGHDYKVEFYLNDDGEKLWKLTDVTTGQIKLTGSPENVDDDAPIVDGLQIKVSGAPADFKNFLTVANAAGPIDPPVGAAADFQGFPVPNRPGASQQVGAGAWMFHTGDNGGSNDGGTFGSYTAFKGRSMRNDNFDRLVPFDWEMRFTAQGSWAVRAFQDGLLVKVPFELWCIGVNTPDDPSDDYKLIPWILDFDESFTYNLESWGQSSTHPDVDPELYEHSVSGGDNDPFTDWIYWRAPDDVTPGTAGYDAYEAAIDIAAGTDGTYDYGGAEVIGRSVLVNFNGGSAPPFNMDLPEEGTIFRLISTKPNQVGGDVFTFTAPTVTENADLAKDDVKEINVFPNPYYGVNPLEVTKYQKYVTFTHLPPKAKIRIFNLAGQLVRTLDKNDTDQFFRWDLANQSGLPIASGLYIAYIELPDLGTTKILKLAIILEQQLLDRF